MHHCIETFHLRISFVNVTKPTVFADLATFTEETLLYLLKKPFMFCPNASLNSFRNNVPLFSMFQLFHGGGPYHMKSEQISTLQSKSMD